MSNADLRFGKLCRLAPECWSVRRLAALAGIKKQRAYQLLQRADAEGILSIQKTIVGVEVHLHPEQGIAPGRNFETVLRPPYTSVPSPILDTPARGGPVESYSDHTPTLDSYSEEHDLAPDAIWTGAQADVPFDLPLSEKLASILRPSKMNGLQEAVRYFDFATVRFSVGRKGASMRIALKPFPLRDGAEAPVLDTVEARFAFVAERVARTYGLASWGEPTLIPHGNAKYTPDAIPTGEINHKRQDASWVPRRRIGNVGEENSSGDGPADEFVDRGYALLLGQFKALKRDVEEDRRYAKERDTALLDILKRLEKKLGPESEFASQGPAPPADDGRGYG